jgi:hypothetical protein
MGTQPRRAASHVRTAALLRILFPTASELPLTASHLPIFGIITAVTVIWRQRRRYASRAEVPLASGRAERLANRPRLPPLTQQDYTDLDAALRTLETILISHTVYPKVLATLIELQRLVGVQQRDQGYNDAERAAKAELLKRQEAEKASRIGKLTASYRAAITKP